MLRNYLLWQGLVDIKISVSKAISYKKTTINFGILSSVTWVQGGQISFYVVYWVALELNNIRCEALWGVKLFSQNLDSPFSYIYKTHLNNYPRWIHHLVHVISCSVKAIYSDNNYHRVSNVWKNFQEVWVIRTGKHSMLIYLSITVGIYTNYLDWPGQSLMIIS